MVNMDVDAPVRDAAGSRVDAVEAGEGVPAARECAGDVDVCDTSERWVGVMVNAAVRDAAVNRVEEVVAGEGEPVAGTCGVDGGRGRVTAVGGGEMVGGMGAVDEGRELTGDGDGAGGGRGL